MNLTANGLLFVMTRYLQTILGHGAFAAGLMLLPMATPVAVLAPVAGRVTARYGPRPAMLAGAALAAAGMAALSFADPARGYWGVLPTLAGVGLGIGTFTAPAVAAAIRAVPPERSGLASGVNNTARQAGTALGVAAYGAVAGPPDHVAGYVTALHVLGPAAAAGWLAVIVMTARSITQESAGYSGRRFVRRLRSGEAAR